MIGLTHKYHPGNWGGILLLSFLFFSCHSPKENRGNQEIEDSVSAFQSELLSSITDSIAKHPDSASLYYDRGAVLFQTEEYDLAKKDLEKAIFINPKIAAYFTALGELYMSQNRQDSAQKYYKKALKLDAQDHLARLQLAFIQFNSKNYRRALQQTDTLLIQNPKAIEALGIQSQSYEALGDTQKAIAIAEETVRINPRNYDVLMRMGDLLSNKGDESALNYYKNAAEINPSAAEPNYSIGLLYKNQHQPQKAITYFNRTIVKDPSYYKAYIEVGNLYGKENNWKKAREIYNLAVSTDPTNSEAYYYRGTAYEKLGMDKAAKSDYQQALVFDEKNKLAQQALNALK